MSQKRDEREEEEESSLSSTQPKFNIHSDENANEAKAPSQLITENNELASQCLSPATPKFNSAAEEEKNSSLNINIVSDTNSADNRAIMSEFSPAADEIEPDAEPNDSSGSEGEGNPKSSTETATAATIFNRPLIYYKRENPLNKRGKKKFSANDENNPVQIILPNNSVCLGYPAHKGADSGSQAALDNASNVNDIDNVIVYANANEEQRSRGKVFFCLAWFLFAADLVLISVLYSKAANTDDTTFNSGSRELNKISYGCVVLEIALGLIGMLFKSQRLLTVFIVAFYIDSLINLIRVYSVLQFVHFVLQISLAHIMTQYKYSLGPIWFQPIQ
jgi:hypothetical protein